jgi:hypothetical protein
MPEPTDHLMMTTDNPIIHLLTGCSDFRLDYGVQKVAFHTFPLEDAVQHAYDMLILQTEWSYTRQNRSLTVI